MERALGEAALAAFESCAERPLDFMGRWLLQPSEPAPANFDLELWEHFKAMIKDGVPTRSWRHNESPLPRSWRHNESSLLLQ